MLLHKICANLLSVSIVGVVCYLLLPLLVGYVDYLRLLGYIFIVRSLGVIFIVLIVVVYMFVYIFSFKVTHSIIRIANVYMSERKAYRIRRELLIALYDATNGENWRNNTNWKTYKPLMTWAGVCTDQYSPKTEFSSGEIFWRWKRGVYLNERNPYPSSRLVRKLLFYFIRRGGSFDSGIVYRLSLSNNALSGQIPVELSKLTSLEELKLEGNPGLYAPSDAEFRAWLANLKEFSIDKLDQIDDSDRAVLIALYDATNGKNWRKNTNWKTAKPLSGWYGVSTNDSGQVIKLSLWDNDLSGQIPPELGQLENLTLLELENNGLSGQVPVELGQLTKLQQLWLHNNDLSGQIPPELGQLENLTLLGLQNNGLSGQVPVELGQLTKLQQLWLQNNGLSGQVPPELGQLENLTSLWLYNNKLSGQIPPELGQLENLTSLWLYNNDLSGQIPPELGQLTKLEELSLRDNKLSGQIPTVLGQLRKLKELVLYNNALSGGIPVQLGQLDSLEYLGLHNNGLSGPIPVQLGQLTKLQRLALHNNDLSGQIPPELGQLTKLEELSLRDNKLSGQIPPELGQLENLTILYLYNNKLSGQIPPELGQLTKLEELSLRYNGLSGQIPPELGQLENLTRLWLYNNKLSGQIPPELGQLQNLTILHLYNNGLSGQIPVELSKLTSLEELELEGNPGLYAPSDAEFRAWLANLKKFSIDNLDQIDDSDRYEELAAKFEGLMDKLDAVSLVPISDDLDPIDASDRAALIALYDATNGENWGNNTNWKTDKPLGEWYGVSTNDSGQVIELSLYYNGLSGQIPPELGQLQNLIGLRLYNNKLSGQIPPELGQLENLEELRLEGNPGLSAPSDAAFQAWLANLKEFSFDGPDLKEIERLLEGVKSPGDQVEVLAFLKLYLGLTQTLKSVWRSSICDCAAARWRLRSIWMSFWMACSALVTSLRWSLSVC